MTRVVILGLIILFSKTVVLGQNSPFDEKTIYTKVINAFLKDLETEEQTLVIKKDLDTMDLSETVFIDTAILKTLKPLTVFNKDRQILQDNLVLTDYKLIFTSDKELKRIFKKSKSSRDRWTNFYRKYPKSGGLLETSQIYLDSTKTKGLIYISILRGGLNGAGYVIYFDMNDPKTIKLSEEIWVS